MAISDVLLEAIEKIETFLNASGLEGESGGLMRDEIVTLVNRMKEVQRKLDSDPTVIDEGEDDD